MVKVGLGLGLGSETLHQFGIACQVGAQNLDGLGTLQKHVNGLVNHTHPAFAYFPHDAVIANQRSDHNRFQLTK